MLRNRNSRVYVKERDGFGIRTETGQVRRNRSTGGARTKGSEKSSNLGEWGAQGCPHWSVKAVGESDSRKMGTNLKTLRFLEPGGSKSAHGMVRAKLLSENCCWGGGAKRWGVDGLVGSNRLEEMQSEQYRQGGSPVKRVFPSGKLRGESLVVSEMNPQPGEASQ